MTVLQQIVQHNTTGFARYVFDAAFLSVKLLENDNYFMEKNHILLVGWYLHDTDKVVNHIHKHPS